MESPPGPSDVIKSEPTSAVADDARPGSASGDAYLLTSNIDLEQLDLYQEGGYHPVHIGDKLGTQGRYQVLHKLGQGGFGTVWLCSDQTTRKYVALKIHISCIAEDRLFDLRVAGLEWSSPGREYIAVPTDHFIVTGPNGKHQCLVLPVFGSPVAPDLWRTLPEGTDGWLVRLHVALQATQAMGFLHRHKICHGDFRPANILIHLQSFDHLGKDELLSLLGPPARSEVRTRSGNKPSKSFPEYLVYPAELSRLTSQYMSGKICVIDFGEAYFFSTPPELLGIADSYLPPEELVVLDLTGEQDSSDAAKDDDCAGNSDAHEGSPSRQPQQSLSRKPGTHRPVKGPAHDMWALGCTLFEIMVQIPLFYMIQDRDELLAEMVRLFGKFPDPLWDQWKARKDWFDDHGKWLRRGHISLEKYLALPRDKRDDSRRTGLPEDLQGEMAHLLRRILRYEPEARASAEQLCPDELVRILDKNLEDRGVKTAAAGPSSPSAALSFEWLLESSSPSEVIQQRDDDVPQSEGSSACAGPVHP
ncbi:CMGC/SRPK protein kinase [Magnaporthiopsis poae ATCC 64411]|uniref:EKC/KEOPS complex subunit BUD32 n=1 Tax=Magnaporthiopsis poae (strain ATCC 64411 / 73-15) TaxID=644358 RepID=A0A0C4EA70_MAGP6|nr:CMGC/SRPK protein kinase [Magnaporthiopsis poae ATCC 64411]